MPSARTSLTEVATALGCTGVPDLDWGVLQRPPIAGVGEEEWNQIEAELRVPASRRVALTAFANGIAFLEHRDGLRDRPPLVIEWTGGRKPPGDQAIPADLRIDHVYAISCKYLSKIVLNAAPGRLFDALLQPASLYDRGDWYEAIAPDEHRELATAAAAAFGVPFTGDGALNAKTRMRLKQAFGRHAQLDGEVAKAYRSLCETVSVRSAERWSSSLASAGRGSAENLLWRMLRIASAPYYVLGVGPRDTSLRLRVMTPWDWRQRFELRRFHMEASGAGQPQVTWLAMVRDRASDEERMIRGHVEVRWSHGRFGGPPEAKVYVDTPHSEVPGYVPLA